MRVPMENRTPALFLDRDGVVNRDLDYLYRADQVHFTPGIFDLCRVAQSFGHKIIIVTNQSGIARGLYSEDDFHSLMNWMAGQFAQAHVRLDGYYYCPHHPEIGIGEYRKDCPDRKPQPGMILRAAREHNIDLARSFLVGDRCSDIQAGVEAGVGWLLLLNGNDAKCNSDGHYFVVPTLTEVAAFLVSRRSGAQ